MKNVVLDELSIMRKKTFFLTYFTHPHTIAYQTHNHIQLYNTYARTKRSSFLAIKTRAFSIYIYCNERNSFNTHIITSMESPYPLYHLSPLRRFAASRPDDYGNPEQQGVLLCWCYSNNTRAKNLVSTLRDECDTRDDRYNCVTYCAS